MNFFVLIFGNITYNCMLKNVRFVLCGICLEQESMPASGSSLAPREQVGARRNNEMKMLYGKDAAMIHGMETALQLNFNRNCDLKQPQYWPNLPINIKFE